MLYEDHVEQVARYVARRTAAHDVQDVVAETFLIAWRRLDELPKDAIPWLFVTARNVMANSHRSSERQRALENKLATAAPWLLQAPVTSGLSEIDQRLLRAIAGLPEREREAFMLIAWDGLDPARAARAAGCSAPAFRMRLHRARRRLQEQIGPLRPFASLTEIPSLKETR